MRRVILESPYAGDVVANLAYARDAMRDCFRRGEAPFASHLLFPQIFDDAKPDERRRGLEAGFAWGEVADATVVYIDRGVSPGMSEGIARATAAGRPVEYRSLRGGAALRRFMRALRAPPPPRAGMIRLSPLQCRALVAIGSLGTAIAADLLERLYGWTPAATAARLANGGLEGTGCHYGAGSGPPAERTAIAQALGRLVRRGLVRGVVRSVRLCGRVRHVGYTLTPDGARWLRDDAEAA